MNAYEGHTKACAIEQANRIVAREAWFKVNPKACRRCEGSGVLKGSYDYDTGLDDAEPCGCVDKGHCPRCGGQTIDKETGLPINGECSECGWTGVGPEDVAPPPFEGCSCDDTQLGEHHEVYFDDDTDAEAYYGMGADHEYHSFIERTTKGR